MELVKASGVVLTIAIPTWNRAEYLRKNLTQLLTQMSDLSEDIEILVSDNSSIDDTDMVVNDLKSKGAPIRYIRNSENIGSDSNIAQCFNESKGRYVLILGDDDILIDGTLGLLVELLKKNCYGVVSMRPYGYEQDFNNELPVYSGKVLDYRDTGDFVVKMGSYATLISANVISKEILSGVDARQFCGTNLVQTYLVYQAAIKSSSNAYIDNYLVACKRNNSGGYDFSKVFVERFGEVLEYAILNGLSEGSAVKLKSKMLIGYYPYYIWRLRMVADSNKLQQSWNIFNAKFSGYFVFYVFLYPIFFLPRPLAIVWGAGAVFVGRVISGDIRRGVYFFRNWVFRRFGALNP